MRHTAFAVLRVVLGCFLLFTAALKGHALLSGFVTRGALFSSPSWQVAAIEVELLLGLWLLSGRAVNMAWLAAICFFALAFAASLYMALTGQRSCGCFGVVPVNPWWTLGLDAMIVAALAIWRAGSRQRPEDAMRNAAFGMRNAGPVSAIAIAAAVAAALLLIPKQTLAAWRGESLLVEPMITDVGTALRGAQTEFPVSLTNLTSEPVRIIGGTTSCGCVATGGLPVTLPPGESAAIRVRMKFGGTPGRFEHAYKLLTDCPSQPMITARFTGWVAEEEESE